MNVQAVLFDVDGTLVDSNEFHVAAWTHAFKVAGHPVPAERIRQQIGKGADMLIPSLLPQLTAEEQKPIAATHKKVFREQYMPRVVAFPRAAELIDTLHAQGTKVLLASSSDRVEVEHYMELLDVSSSVADIASGDEAERSKPAPDVFASALAKAAPLKADEVIAVGDTPYDAISAAKCGIRTVAVRSGGFADDLLRSAGAIAIYDSVADLLERLRDSPLRPRTR
ncbi:MAG: HAD family hydrolase [Povalibacter sp.]|jgi:HAD superfamily hydrolase (TIGR01509 family)